MDPVTLSMIMSGIFGGLGGLFGGGGAGAQERASFENETGGGHSLDPRQLMGAGLNNLNSVMGMFTDRLGQGYELPGAYAQAPPAFAGGGLPMPIGLTGRDPALDDPARHLSIPGVHMRSPGSGGFDMLATLGDGSQNLPSGNRLSANIPPSAGGPSTPGHPSDTRPPLPPYSSPDMPNPEQYRPRTAYDPKNPNRYGPDGKVIPRGGKNEFDSARAALDLLGVK